MNTVYISPNQALYKGVKNLGAFNVMNRAYRAKLFWVTKNPIQAARYGNVSKYVPTRRLKLLKLTYRTVEKILASRNASPNLKRMLEHTWGRKNKTYHQQYRGILENNTMESAALQIMSKYRHDQNRTAIWRNAAGTPLRSGRISVVDMNVRTYGLIRNAFGEKFDGIWSPAVRSPYHGKFDAELVLFEPSKILQKMNYPAANRETAFRLNRYRLENESTKTRMRARKPNTAIVTAGTRVYTAGARSPKSPRVRLSPLQGPGKRFFNENTSVVSAHRLFNNRLSR